MANPTHTLLIANAKSAEYIHARSHINMDSRHSIYKPVLFHTYKTAVYRHSLDSIKVHIFLLPVMSST